MSEDFVNQITLSYLISKTQLQKLNKKLKDTTETNRKTDKEIYEERIKTLFNSLLVNQEPDNLLQDVKTGFEFFIDKCIYYLKASDNNELLEKERTNNVYDNDIIHDDIDYEKEERAIENGNYTERNKYEEQDDEEQDDEEQDDEEQDDEEQDDEEQDDEEQYDEDKKLNTNKNSVIVKQKFNKTKNSIGVDDIQKLPLDWFQHVRKDYKKNQIIPRK
jgi:hypothetical protein